MTWLVTVALLAAAGPNSEIDGFAARIFRSAGHTLPFRLFQPAQHDTVRRYPLVLFLHGVEAVGSGNQRQISGMDRAGSHLWISPENQQNDPCFVVAPQCPAGHLWVNPLTRAPGGYLRLVMALLDNLERELPVDEDRIYVTGQSMGGFATWALIENWPDRFAAAVPVCGGGRVSKARNMADVPVWAFHGAADPIVPAHESRRMIAALQRVGGRPRYTEYRFVLHDSWKRAWTEPGLARWVFAQSRAGRANERKQEVGNVP